MKAEDLRIGNKLFIPGLDVVVNVKAIFKTHFRCEGSGGVQFDESIRINFQPIPLTEEWLKRVDWKGYKYLYFNSNFCLDEVGHLYYHNDYTGINVNYVHQLQNLYFALTGEELTFKN